MTVDREKVAVEFFDMLVGDLVFWEDASSARKKKFLAGVDAALASIEAQGLVIVPVELLSAFNDLIEDVEEGSKYGASLRVAKAIIQLQKGGSDDS